MATKTTTLKLPLAHIYHLTADSNNDTGYTMEEITSLMHEHGGSHVIEVTVTHPVPSEEDIARAAEEEAARVAEIQARAAEEVIPPDADPQPSEPAEEPAG